MIVQLEPGQEHRFITAIALACTLATGFAWVLVPSFDMCKDLWPYTTLWFALGCWLL